jgi:alpha-methylacyl-CoA racemase
VEVGGVIQPAPAPRFSRTQASVPKPFALPGEHGEEVLAELGFSREEVAELKRERALLVRDAK